MSSNKPWNFGDSTFNSSESEKLKKMEFGELLDLLDEKTKDNNIENIFFCLNSKIDIWAKGAIDKKIEDLESTLKVLDKEWEYLSDHNWMQNDMDIKSKEMDKIRKIITMFDSFMNLHNILDDTKDAFWNIIWK